MLGCITQIVESIASFVALVVGMSKQTTTAAHSIRSNDNRYRF
jgi:hypothetical protein